MKWSYIIKVRKNRKIPCIPDEKINGALRVKTLMDTQIHSPIDNQ